MLSGAVDLGSYEFGIGDYDCDKAVTPADFAAWTWCMEGPNYIYSYGCEALDFTGDGRIDLADFAAFQRVVAPRHGESAP